MTSSILVIIFLVICWLNQPAKADMPRCDGDSPDFSGSPYCLPFDYNLDIIPPTEGPLNVNVDIFVFEVNYWGPHSGPKFTPFCLIQVSKIDDISLSMTFELYFDLTWNESRLLINESAPEWETDGSVMGSTNYVKSLWLPDIQIYNIKQFQTRAIVTDVAGLIIFKNKNILYTVSTEAVISCPMKFSAYPLDHQVSFLHQQQLGCCIFTKFTQQNFTNCCSQQARMCSNCLLESSHPLKCIPKTVCVNFTKRNAPNFFFRNIHCWQENMALLCNLGSNMVLLMPNEGTTIREAIFMQNWTSVLPFFVFLSLIPSSFFPRA